jgi:hypothetical protein
MNASVLTLSPAARAHADLEAGRNHGQIALPP